MGISRQTLFRGLRRQLGDLPTSGAVGGLTASHAQRMRVIRVDEAKGKVHLCIERHPPDLETGIPVVCWQFWAYDGTPHSLDFVEEVPPVSSYGLCTTEEHGRMPRNHLSAKELKKIKNAPSLPESLWPLQQTTREVAHILGITSRQVLRLRDWGLLREVDMEQSEGPYWTCLFNAVEVEEFKQLHPDLTNILCRRDARHQLEL